MVVTVAAGEGGAGEAGGPGAQDGLAEEELTFHVSWIYLRGQVGNVLARRTVNLGSNLGQGDI